MAYYIPLGGGSGGGGGSPTGPAGGDLSGSYPSPQVDGLRGRAVSSTAPSIGQALVWNGTSWAPALISGSGVPGTVPSPGGPYGGILAGKPVGIKGGVMVLADAGDATTMPAVGIYTGSGTNLIRFGGLSDSDFAGLTVDQDQFVAVGGGLTPTPPSGVGRVEQRVGRATTSSSIYVSLGNPIYL